MKQIKDIISTQNWGKIEENLKIYYSNDIDKNLINFKKMFFNLFNKKPAENSDSIYIHINCENILVKDKKLSYFEVIGYTKEKSIIPLETMNWDEWLSFYIDNDTIFKYKEEEIMSHVLWDMSYAGFNENDPKKYRDFLYKNFSFYHKQNKFLNF